MSKPDSERRSSLCTESYGVKFFCLDRLKFIFSESEFKQDSIGSAIWHILKKCLPYIVDKPIIDI